MPILPPPPSSSAILKKKNWLKCCLYWGRETGLFLLTSERTGRNVRQWEEERQTGSKTKLESSEELPPRTHLYYASCLKVFKTFPNSTTNWRPYVQRYEPVRDISHANIKRTWCFLLQSRHQLLLYSALLKKTGSPLTPLTAFLSGLELV